MGEISEEEILAAYHQQVLKENAQDHSAEQNLGRKLRLVSFESRSTGKNRPRRRRSREVTFIVDATRKGHEVVWQVIDGEIRSRKNRVHLHVEELAMETLTDLPPEQRTPDKLLERLRLIRNTRIR